MTVLPVRVLPDDKAVLRRKANKVPRLDTSIQKLIDDMIESMYAAHGVGLAAPQIGVSLRLAVFGLPEEEPFALINPEIVRRSGERLLPEGCLSVPGYRGEVTRSLKVTVKGLDRFGKPVRLTAEDNLRAQVLEHEIDHLNGVLYIDYIDSEDDLWRVAEPDGEEAEDDEADGEVPPAEGVPLPEKPAVG